MGPLPLTFMVLREYTLEECTLEELVDLEPDLLDRGPDLLNLASAPISNQEGFGAYGGRRKAAKQSPKGGAPVGWGVHLITGRQSRAHAAGWVREMLLGRRGSVSPFIE